MAKKTPASKEGRMTIWEHLGELRRRLTVIIIAFIVVAAVLYVFAPDLILFLVQPVSDTLLIATGATDIYSALKVFDPMEAFILRFKVSLFFAAIFTSPIWVWQILAFFLPALKPNERKWVLPTFFAGVALFVIGAVFCYFMIINPAFAWMVDQLSGFGSLMASAPGFVNLILLFEVAFGLAFQLPLIVFYLIVFNIVPYKKLRKSWRVVYVVLMIFCAMITPDVSPVPMLLMFVAMGLLYESSLLLSRIVLSRRIKAKEAEAAAAAAAEGSEDDA
jgi:sec-independent protein translocase protein TatC